MEFVYGILFFFLGTIFGSFGSVLFFRLGEKCDWKTLKGILIGRSECPQCHHQLAWKDLVPLFSFLFQRGTCRYCKKTISWFYPLLELGSGLIFLLCFLFLGFGNLPLLLFWMFLNWIFFLLLMYDVKYFELHVPLWGGALLLSVLFQVLSTGMRKEMCMGILIFGGLYLLIYLFAKWYVRMKFHTSAEGFGQGDVMMAVLIGSLAPFLLPVHAYFPWVSLVLLFVLSSCLIGLLWYGLSSFFSKKPSVKDIEVSQVGGNVIPFLPSMILSFWILLVFGNQFFSFFSFL